MLLEDFLCEAHGPIEVPSRCTIFNGHQVFHINTPFDYHRFQEIYTHWRLSKTPLEKRQLDLIKRRLVCLNDFFHLIDDAQFLTQGFKHLP